MCAVVTGAMQDWETRLLALGKRLDSIQIGYKSNISYANSVKLNIRITQYLLTTKAQQHSIEVTIRKK